MTACEIPRSSTMPLLSFLCYGLALARSAKSGRIYVVPLSILLYRLDKNTSIQKSLTALTASQV